MEKNKKDKGKGDKMLAIKYIVYGLYMIIMRLRGIKRFFLEKIKGEEAAYLYGQKVFYKWSVFTIKVVGLNITALGQENIPNETCVFMGNHQSILDIPLLRYTTGRKIDLVAKEELLKVPVVGYWIKNLRCVAINRDNPREGIKAINKAIEYVKQGCSYVVFPEGTRSKDGKINEFKKGSLKIATKTKVKIVPFAIEGTSKAFEDTRKFIPQDIKIIFGTPIEMEGISKEEEKTLNEEVFKIVNDLHNKIS